MNVLLCLALLQAESAEEVFRAFEGAVRKSKLLKVSYETEIVRDGKKGEGSLVGDLRLEEGKKLVLTMKTAGAEGKNSGNLEMICDGVTFRSTVDGKVKESDVRSAPEVLQRFDLLLRDMVARLGVCSGFFLYSKVLLGESAGKGGAKFEFKNVLKATDVRRTAPDGDARTLTYSLTIEGESAPREFKLWYEPRTGKPIKRATTVDIRGSKAVLTETYAELDWGPAEAPAPEPSDAEVMKKFIEADIKVAREYVKSGKKDAAIKMLEELVKKYPAYGATKEARRLLDELRP